PELRVLRPAVREPRHVLAVPGAERDAAGRCVRRPVPAVRAAAERRDGLPVRPAPHERRAALGVPARLDALPGVGARPPGLRGWRRPAALAPGLPRPVRAAPGQHVPGQGRVLAEPVAPGRGGSGGTRSPAPTSHAAPSIRTALLTL